MSVVILGFSGGLDTTFSVLKLKEAGHDVVAVTVDIGQQMCADQIRARAVEAGCADFVLVDGVADFAEFFVAPAIQANALYQDAYPLATALGRPYIAYCLAHVARSHGTTVLSHGCTGKGNDQARIDVMGVRTLMPVASFINPVRDDALPAGYSRDTELEYLLRHGLVHESDDLVALVSSASTRRSAQLDEAGALTADLTIARRFCFQLTTSGKDQEWCAFIGRMLSVI